MAHVCFTCFIWTKMCHQSWLVPAYDFMFVSVQPVMCDLQKVIMAEHESHAPWGDGPWCQKYSSCKLEPAAAAALVYKNMPIHEDANYHCAHAFWHTSFCCEWLHLTHALKP